MTGSMLGLVIALGSSATEAGDGMAVIDAQIAAHAGRSGVYVLERGEEALLARAWLADHAREAIEVQYFIWSTDNIGVLASEALLRCRARCACARDRGRPADRRAGCSVIGAGAAPQYRDSHL